MYSTVLQIAHDIVVIWWALMIILGVILLVMAIVLVGRVTSMVNKGNEIASMISQYVMLPFTYIGSLFSKWSDEEEEKPVRKRTTTRKK